MAEMSTFSLVMAATRGSNYALNISFFSYDCCSSTIFSIFIKYLWFPRSRFFRRKLFYRKRKRASSSSQSQLLTACENVSFIWRIRYKKNPVLLFPNHLAPRKWIAFAAGIQIQKTLWKVLPLKLRGVELTATSLLKAYSFQTGMKIHLFILNINSGV